MRVLQANFLILLATFLWGIGNVAQKTILEDLGVFTSTGLRCLIGSIFLLPLVLAERGGLSDLPKGSKGLAIAVVTSFACGITLLQVAMGSTSVTNASFFVDTCSVFTPFVAWFLVRVWPVPIVWPSMVLTLTGVGLLSGGLAQFQTGDALALLSAVSYAVWVVTLGLFVTRFARPGTITYLQFVTTGVVCTAIGLAVEPITADALLGALPELVVLGVFSTGVAYLLQAIAQQYVSPVVAAITGSAEALFSTLGAWLVLGETITPSGWIGIVLILFGLSIVQFNPAPGWWRRAARLAGSTRHSAIDLASQPEQDIMTIHHPRAKSLSSAAVLSTSDEARTAGRLSDMRSRKALSWLRSMITGWRERRRQRRLKREGEEEIARLDNRMRDDVGLPPKLPLPEYQKSLRFLTPPQVSAAILQIESDRKKPAE